MTEKRTTFPVGVNVLVLRDNQLLLGKRKNIYGAGSWGLPGGHLELGEGVALAALRELKEETGLSSDNLKFINFINDVREDEHYLQIGFLAEDIKVEPTLKEPDRCEEWKWFDLESLPENIFIAHQRQIMAFKENKYFLDK